MKNRLLLLLAVFSALFFSQCLKDDQDTQDRNLILRHLEENNISATEHPSGIFYTITTEGTGNNPTLNNTVTVKYKGFLLNGNVFDQTSGSQTATFPLQNLITGWQIGIPLLKKGGKGTFWIPSSLGYGNVGLQGIPPNSVLVFDIELVDFQ
jgi:FKBP-type peptidyl-prolyl cis-trans isomerase FkpA